MPEAKGHRQPWDFCAPSWRSLHGWRRAKKSAANECENHDADENARGKKAKANGVVKRDESFMVQR